MSYIKIEKLSKSYKEKNIFQEFSLNIEKGSFISFVGPFGCGKTTLLKLLAGIENIDTGQIFINSQTPETLKKDKKMGYVFQEPLLLPWKNVEENIRLPLELSHKHNFKKVDQLLKIVGLEEKKNNYPKELSGGMQQIVSILRAVINDPAVLLLDEPLSAIDEINRNKLQDILINLHKANKQTTILVTHSIHEAVYLSDKVYILGDYPVQIIDCIKPKYPRMKRYKNSLETLKTVTKIRKKLEKAVK